MSKREFRFRLEFSTETKTVRPIWSDATSKEWTPVSNEVFSREKLTQKLIFVGQDFTDIMAETFEHEFIIHIDERNADGTYADDWFKGFFSITDCDVDEDETRIEVNPEPLDRYKPVMDKLNTEFDFNTISPTITPLKLNEQSLIQIYLPGSEFITNIYQGTQWEENVSKVVDLDATLKNTYFFENGQTFVFIAGDATNLNPDVSGFYVDDPAGLEFVRDDGMYRIKKEFPGFDFQYEIQLVSDGSTLYTAPLDADLFGLPQHNANGALFTGNFGHTCRAIRTKFYSRIVTNQLTIDGGTPTDVLPTDDIAPNSRFDRVYPLNYANFIVSDLNNTTSQGYGKFDTEAASYADLYFEKPTTVAPIGKLYAVSLGDWKQASLWFYFDSALVTIIQHSLRIYQINTAYKLGDVIRAFLQLIDSTVTYLDDADHSVFLHGTNPVRTITATPFVALKNTIIATASNQESPIDTNKVRFSDFLTFLNDFYQLKWFIDDSNRFRLEHISYFENGKSYTAEVISIDTTTYLEAKTKKPWGFKSKKYNFNKTKLPERIIHKWMDDSSEQFNGVPIISLSKYVDPSANENRNMSLFTSDLDLIHVKGNTLAKNGFFFGEAILAVSDYVVPVVYIDFGFPNQYNLNNGYAAMIYAHDKYFRHNLPATSVNLNGVDITATSVRRTKVGQPLQLPKIDAPDPMVLITTEIGNGIVEKMSENMSSGVIQVTLIYKTE